MSAHLREAWRKLAEFDSFQERIGQCYEVAGTRILEGVGDYLVHGTIQGLGAPRIDHAWVEKEDGSVFETVMGKWYSKREWEDFANPTVKHRYNQIAARVEMLRHMHWGPWE